MSITVNIFIPTLVGEYELVYFLLFKSLKNYFKISVNVKLDSPFTKNYGLVIIMHKCCFSDNIMFL